jgi:hypothetical protein
MDDSRGPYFPRQAAVSALMEANEPDRLLSGRMKMLAASSGSAATLAQNAGHTPFRCKYISTFDT